MIMASVKKGKPELRKKGALALQLALVDSFLSRAVTPAVVIRQRKVFRRKDGIFIYFEVNQSVLLSSAFAQRSLHVLSSTFLLHCVVA